MKEIKEILDRVAAFEDGENAVLATVVDVRGSGYRLPGARMLILESGETFGMVSGGCLEADVLERAKKVLQSGRAEVFTYDTTDDENSVFSLNMGCRGVIRILLELFGKDRKTPFFWALLLTADATRRLTTMATVIKVENENRVKVGDRMFNFGYADISTFPSVVNDLKTFAVSSSDYEIVEYETERGVAELAFENLWPPLQLLIFGANADAVPLAKIASELGWQVSVFDHRPAYLKSERFPTASKLVMRDEAGYSFTADARTAAVIMTHNYERDIEILPELLRSDVFYIGALGPKRRTEQLLGELPAAGNNFTEQQLANLYAPAGLDIGADTPEAIALSIVAEIQCVIRARKGGHLRDRKGSIYDRK